MNSDDAKLVIEATLDELKDRSGFDNWWDSIDDDCRRDIRRASLKRAFTEVPDRVIGYH